MYLFMLCMVIALQICLVYDEIFSSSPEKWNILHNKTNEICNSVNSTQNLEEYFAKWKRQLIDGGSVYAWTVYIYVLVLFVWLTAKKDVSVW